MLRYTSVLFVAAFALAGCASAGTGTPSEGQSPTRRDTNVITADELATVSEGDLYSAIQRLRPSYFQTRGITSPGVGTAPEFIQVYVDGSRAGDISSLRQIRPSEVKEVRRLNAGEATQLYGTGHTMGAIVVKRK